MPKKKKSQDDEFEEWKKSKQLLKPKDQLELADWEMKEPHARILLTHNPLKPDGLVEWSFAEGSFIPLHPPSNYVVALDIKGTLMHRLSPEGLAQLAGDTGLPAEDEEEKEEVEVEEGEQKLEEGEPKPAEVPAEAKPEDEEGEKGEEGAEGGEEGQPAEAAPPAEAEAKGDAEDDEEGKPSKPKKLTNQFNYSDRAAQTYNLPTRSQETQTIPPPKENFSSNVLQWIIYDDYLTDYNRQQAELELERLAREAQKAPITKHAPPPPKKSGGRAQLSEAVQARVAQCWKTLERMINQNINDEINKDYKYWDDPSDQYREEEGTLLPLWKFTYEKTRKHSVTDLQWSPWYYDLVAASLGYFDHMKPLDTGYLCLYSLKNPSYPEYICQTQSAVMTVDNHPDHPYMIVIGLYDGNTIVYNIQASCKTPAYKSDEVTQKHRGIVWDVTWRPDLPDGELNYYSIGADGNVNHWILLQTEMSVTTIITLCMDKEPLRGPDGTQVILKSTPSCIKFHPSNRDVFLVGTEEGLIYKCSTSYSATYLFTYRAHSLAVYRMDYNYFNSNIFVSGSADWRVKIWEDNRHEPLYVFDLGAFVGDVKWAPYSSTVLAAGTIDGKLSVFDLNISKYKPICIQAVVSKKKNKLTRIRFNQRFPIILVGDEKGMITALKLSPNLRVPCKPPKKMQHLDQTTLQIMKLDKLLSVVREPVVLERPPDPAASQATTK
ncbi:dynein intermediate chain 2, ciliary [Agrilus planipennis]|uniref:Dynein intermediate chain 2, ciliary n=1 Tax=Agrilus planipennis TaxID=224129 RepID=A0A1W4XBB9_AGRPL|nr:dynein intermediate chain 2, ciliary [Agrilus planipennis]